MYNKILYTKIFLSFLITSISILFIGNCNIVKCGQLSSCKEQSKLLTAATIWRLVTKPGRPGVFIEAISQSGANDTPAAYTGFTGAVSKGTGSGQWNEQAVRECSKRREYIH